MIAYKDVDGNVSSYAYDSFGRLSSQTDAYGAASAWAYATMSDTSYPVGAVKSITYGNGTKQEFTYDSLGRLDRADSRAPAGQGGGVFDYIDLAYNASGMITGRERKDGASFMTATYLYDEAYRLTAEIYKDASAVEKHRRAYSYTDGAGNRTGMIFTNSDSVSRATTYSYGNREQLASHSGYLDWGTNDTGSGSFTFDSRGNMTARSGGAAAQYSWNEDNRLVSAHINPQNPKVSPYYVYFAYDYAGRRILKNVDGGARTRYFFHGLTEEIKKVSIANNSDSAFAFAVKEDGESASDWAVYDNDPAGASVTAVTDTERHPDGVKKVIKCQGLAGPGGDGNANGFIAGDTDADASNPNASPWGDAHRVISFWHKGGYFWLYVPVSTSAGWRYVTYIPTAGTDSTYSNYIYVHLGAGAAGGSGWKRFERDVAADVARVTGGAAAWQNTDGLLIRPDEALNYAFYIDDIRLSNSASVEHNTLGAGAIGHILRHRTMDPATSLSGGGGDANDFPGASSHWFHYDQVGSILTESGTAGTVTRTHWQDAFGNQLQSWQSGLWEDPAGQGGWGHNTKEYDRDAGLAYMYQRWYASDLGTFSSKAPRQPMV